MRNFLELRGARMALDAHRKLKVFRLSQIWSPMYSKCMSHADNQLFYQKLISAPRKYTSVNSNFWGCRVNVDILRFCI